MADTIKYEGLGGWLILVCIGLILNPIYVVFLIWTEFLPAFEPETWDLMTNPTSEYYNPYWTPVIIGELVGNAVYLVLSLFLLWLFFTKKRLFPMAFIFMYAYQFAFITLDSYVVSLVFPEIAMFDEEFLKQLGRTSISGLIWITYMCVSKRVKATFVN
jgi:hypothetical protein